MLTILMLSISGYSQGHRVRIAFMGNSITIGANLANPTVEAYPSQVSAILSENFGDTCVIGNFAVSGRTLLRKGDFPLWNEKQYTDSWNFAPDIVFILLGTNDTKPQNWDSYGDEYYADYQAMIDSFRVRNPRVKFMCGFPPPCFETENLNLVWLINDSIIVNGVIPIVDSIAKVNGAEIVDFYHTLRDSGNLFPDAVHPNAVGQRVMAQLVVDKMLESDIIHQVETGYTFVTSVKTNKRTIPPGEAATITWTTINADSVMFEGQKVDPNGTVTINPLVTKVYTVYAYGPKSIDSMKISQNVYIPELEKIGANPRTATVDQYDSTTIVLSFYDQESKPITNKTFNVDWNVNSGGGYLINKTSTSATFVASEAGKSTVRGTVGAIFIDVKFTVNAKVASPTLSNENNFRLFPNPANNYLNIEMETIGTSPSEIRIYDLKGTLCQKELFQPSASGKHTFSVKTGKLGRGFYLLEVENGGLKYSRKFNKK